MNSFGYPDDAEVLAELGDDFVRAFVDAVDGARDDHAALREWRPSWQASFTNRFLANFLHERIWDRLVRVIDGMSGVHIVDREPIREVKSGTKYSIRVKRHRPGDLISAYPTEAALAFWSNDVLTLDGLESYSLALGYMWDADTRVAGEAVLSFRDGKDNPIWAVQLRRDGGVATGFTWTPVAPDLPEIDLSRVLREDEEENGS